MGRRGRRGYGGCGGRGRLYTCRYTVITRMTSALRWAAMRDILMFQQEVMDKVTRQFPQTTTFLKRKESRSSIEPRSFRLPALPLGQTGSLHRSSAEFGFECLTLPNLSPPPFPPHQPHCTHCLSFFHCMLGLYRHHAIIKSKN